ncbi:hypothetical protein FT670_20255 [Aeromonas jandaei]|nr:hypothetical protein FT670_20255 [Aeromonas jandaei]
MQMESCHFINGDLELTSEQNLQPLVDALVQGGMDCLTLHQEGGCGMGVWSCSPERAITASRDNL